MRILVVNPNTTQAMTDRMVAVGQTVMGPGTELVPITAARGVNYIASRPEALLAGAELLDLIARHENGADAAIVAAFGDPGLKAARDLFDIPVVGMAEAAMLSACMLGDRFAFVTFSHTLERWYADCVAKHGLGARFAGIYIPDAEFASVLTVQDEIIDDLVTIANEAIDRTNADVVILAGAPLAGLASKVAPRIGAPVVDPICAAVCQAEMLVRLGGRDNASKTIPAKDAVGFSPALSKAIAGG
ncbi:MAG: aspartate/glutamate racemase family protein [Roseibium sp.]|nr:aspartate/glutamate racemase family protein [Roseibium sp.]